MVAHDLLGVDALLGSHCLCRLRAGLLASQTHPTLPGGQNIFVCMTRGYSVHCLRVCVPAEIAIEKALLLCQL